MYLLTTIRLGTIRLGYSMYDHLQLFLAVSGVWCGRVRSGPVSCEDLGDIASGWEGACWC